MTDQQPQGDFAAGERAEPQGPARDFAEGEERDGPESPRDFAEGDEQLRPGPPRSFAEGAEGQPVRRPGNAPQRPAPTHPTDREPS
jgi:hypothetical protein